METPDPTAPEPGDDRCPHCGHEVGGAWLACAWCGQPLAAPAELADGSRLSDGRYQVLKVIGRGGFGITYDVGDRRLQRRVAMKELFPESAVRHGSLVLTPPQGRAAFQAARDRFLREARVLARFTHPGIVRVYEVFEEHGTAYLVMELLEGRTLVQLLQQRNRPFDEAEVLDVAGRVAAALRPVHAAGVLHRDVNPSNVMMTHHGRIVVIDFGLARDYDHQQTVGMTRVVTPGYAPLEQYRGQGRFGPSTDVYGLAASCYRLATGKVPVSAVERDAGAELPAPWKLNPGISKAVSDAILDGLELEPEHRPQDLDAFLSRLGVRGLPEGPRSVLLDTVPPPEPESEPVVASPPPMPPVSAPAGPRDGQDRLAGLAGLGGAAGAAAAVGGAVAWNGARAVVLEPAAATGATVVDAAVRSSSSPDDGTRPTPGGERVVSVESLEPVTGATEVVVRVPVEPGIAPTVWPTGVAPRFGAPAPLARTAADADRTYVGPPGPPDDRTVHDGTRVPGAPEAPMAPTAVARPLADPFLRPDAPRPDRVVGAPNPPRVPGAVGPHVPGRRKLLLPLTAVALATAAAAPVLVTAVLVWLVLPAIATVGDSVAHRLRAEHGVPSGWAARHLGPGPMVPVRFLRNVVVSTLRAVPVIGVGAVLLAGWYGLDGLTDARVALDWSLRALGLLVVGVLLATARTGSGRFRTALGLEAMAVAAVPEGRTTERVVAIWIVATFVVAGALWLTPDPFPLP